MEVAVSVSLGALGPLLGKLNALLADDYAGLKVVHPEIHSLRSELSNMNAALQKYAMLEEPDVQVKAWIGEVRELAYDIEDFIDKFIHRARLGEDRHQSSSWVKDFFWRGVRHLMTLGSRSQLANEINELKARVISVKDQRDAYKLDGNACGRSIHSTVDPRLSALFVKENKLVGIDGPRDDLAKWLLEAESGSRKRRKVESGSRKLVEAESGSRKHRKVLSIVGFGGLGKTTLANEVSRKIRGHFDCYALVSVSQKPDLKKILKDVISKLSPEDGLTKDTWDEQKFIAQSKELLQDKRYLVIIDDIWSTWAWDMLKCAFPENNCSSRIVVTTRIFDVASSCCLGRDDRIYEMEPLSDFHSKRLFFGRIFGDEKCCPLVLEEVSNEILKKCGGLPLAIISISGLLANRRETKEEWEKVKRSIGFALDTNQSLEGMKCILSLSYNNLPHHLRACLLYLSTFPEDFEIDRERIVRRWIAEGFISEERGLNHQEVAESYFYELINKSMVQPVDIGYDGRADACRVHDMMLELIISKAKEENFITVLSGQTIIRDPQGYIRRLSIQYTDQQLAAVLATKDLRHARSLTFFHSIKWLPRLFQFEALRVLDFEGCVGLEEYDLESIDKLFQLKYLSLRETWISGLPARIVKLEYLETLDLCGTRITELPTGFFRLTKLLHLLGAAHLVLIPGTRIPDGIGKMTNLQVLSGIDCSTAAVEELGELTSLKELTICLPSADTSNYKRHNDMLFAALCKLASCKLQSLSIHQSGDGNFLQLLYHWSTPPRSLQRFHMSAYYCFPNVPKWIQPGLTNLASLKINLRELRDEDLHALGEIPTLLFLGLWLKPIPKERLTIQGIGFPSLKEFVLGLWDGGAYLSFVEGAMPKLENLALPFHVAMAKPHGFYLGIGHLPCLKEAEVGLYEEGVEYSDTKAAAAAIRNEANVCPNRPRVTILREYVEESSEESGTDED